MFFSFIGMDTREVEMTDQTRVEGPMMEDALDFNDLVVRLLGMKRKKKALGYSVQEIDDDELNETKELNILNSLSGKVVGVNLIQGGGGLMMLSLMI